MKIGGHYVSKACLTRYEYKVIEGDVPALMAEFHFEGLSGHSETVRMWSLLDTGADICIFPAWRLGISIPSGNAPPRFSENTIARRLVYFPQTIVGVGGPAKALVTTSRLKLGGQELPGVYRVAICPAMQYPIIGRQVLNQFIGILDPAQRNLSLSNDALAKIASRTIN